MAARAVQIDEKLDINSSHPLKMSDRNLMKSVVD